MEDERSDDWTMRSEVSGGRSEMGSRGGGGRREREGGVGGERGGRRGQHELRRGSCGADLRRVRVGRGRGPRGRPVPVREVRVVSSCGDPAAGVQRGTPPATQRRSMLNDTTFWKRPTVQEGTIPAA
eukprot:8039825-Pyramimonas_sp.AAC.1